jgi:hypothetical protein
VRVRPELCVIAHHFRYFPHEVSIRFITRAEAAHDLRHRHRLYLTAYFVNSRRMNLASCNAACKAANVHGSSSTPKKPWSSTGSHEAEMRSVWAT